MKKINPKKDTLKSALLKLEISPKMTKAILDGYEGILLNSPISISLNLKESFQGRDLLIKTIMVFDNKYPAWNKNLTDFIEIVENKKRIKTLLNLTK